MCPGRRLYRACRLVCLPAARARRAVSSVGAKRHDPVDLCTAVSCAKQMLLIYTLPSQLDLHERGVQVQILTGKLAGTYSPVGEGKFFFTMMAAFAERERDIVLERTMAGLAAARAKVAPGADPPSWTPTSAPPPTPAAPMVRVLPRSPSHSACPGPAFTATSPRPTPYDERRRWATPLGHTERPVYRLFTIQGVGGV